MLLGVSVAVNAAVIIGAFAEAAGATYEGPEQKVQQIRFPATQSS
jgi:hypothetical protein